MQGNISKIVHVNEQNERGGQQEVVEGWMLSEIEYYTGRWGKLSKKYSIFENMSREFFNDGSRKAGSLATAGALRCLVAVAP